MVQFLRDFFAILRYLGFLVVILGIGFAAFALNSQGNDIFVAIATNDHPFIFLFPFLIVVWSLALWYSGRLILQCFTIGDGDTDKLEKHIRWLPRTFGAFAYIVVIAAFMKAGVAKEASQKLVLFSVLGVLYWLFVTYRRRLFPRSVEKNALKAKATALTKFQKWLAAAGMAISVLLVAIFAVRSFSIGFSRSMWPESVLSLALCSWTFFGMCIVYGSFRIRLPIMPVLLVLMVALGYCNSNHEIRVIAQPADPAVIASRPTLEEYIRGWIKSKSTGNPNDTIPLYIIAAEGGGIRAMVWTGGVMQHLDSIDPSFYDHLFATCSASGGSVGAVMYNVFKYDAGGKDRTTDSLRKNLRRLLQDDYLSPILSAMVYPDFVARLSPVPICCFDRARWLEDSWAKSYHTYFGRGTFDSGFLATFPAGPSNGYRYPAMFLNTTRVETGERGVLSNVKIGPTFTAAFDLFDSVGHDIPLKTAASMSARFPYVTPQAAIPIYGQTTEMNVVDGGYADNSGLQTALQVLYAVQHILSDTSSPDRKLFERVRPKIVCIANHGIGKDAQESKLLREVLTPPRTFISVYDESSTSIDPTARRIVGEAGSRYTFIEDSLVWFPGKKNTFQFPLGWYISDEAAQRILQQAAVAKW